MVTKKSNIAPSYLLLPLIFFLIVHNMPAMKCDTQLQSSFHLPKDLLPLLFSSENLKKRALDMLYMAQTCKYWYQLLNQESRNKIIFVALTDILGPTLEDKAYYFATTADLNDYQILYPLLAAKTHLTKTGKPIFSYLLDKAIRKAPTGVDNKNINDKKALLPDYFYLPADFLEDLYGPFNLLMAAGCDVNHITLPRIEAYTYPLITAASCNYICTKALLKAGANPNVYCRRYKTTPLHNAVAHYDILKLLLKHGASIDNLNGSWNYPEDLIRQRIKSNDELEKQIPNQPLSETAKNEAYKSCQINRERYLKIEQLLKAARQKLSYLRQWCMALHQSARAFYAKEESTLS